MYLLRVPMLVYKPKIMKELMPEKPPHSSKKQQFDTEVPSRYIPQALNIFSKEKN